MIYSTSCGLTIEEFWDLEILEFRNSGIRQFVNSQFLDSQFLNSQFLNEGIIHWHASGMNNG